MKLDHALLESLPKVLLHEHLDRKWDSQSWLSSWTLQIRLGESRSR
jgi:hypothetical protein